MQILTTTDIFCNRTWAFSNKMSFQNSKWLYVARPEGRVSDSNYALVHETIDGSVLANNEIVVKMAFISVDPYMRIQQASRDTWEKPHPLNTVQGAGTIGHVVASNSESFQVGDAVIGYHGWQKYVKCHSSEVKKLSTDIEQISVYLGILGMLCVVRPFKIFMMM